MRVAPHVTPAMAAAGGVAGAVPTPRGPVHVRVATAPEGGPGAVHVRSPAPTELVLSELLLRRLGWLGASSGLGTAAVDVSVDGGVAVRLAAAGGPAGGPREPGTGARTRVAALVLAPGAHVVECVSCGGGSVAAPAPVAAAAAAAAAAVASPPFPPESWPGRLLAVDTWTQGGWRGRYGTDGYVLFSFAPGPADVVSLPAWVAAVRAFDGASNAWVDPPPAGDPRALEDPAGGARAIGCSCVPLLARARVCVCVCVCVCDTRVRTVCADTSR